MFIDDDKELLYVLQQTFLGKYNVLVAETAKCALEQLSHNDIDMIVCDITLPDMIGWDLCKKIKQIIDICISLLLFLQLNKE